MQRVTELGIVGKDQHVHLYVRLCPAQCPAVGPLGKVALLQASVSVLLWWGTNSRHLLRIWMFLKARAVERERAASGTNRT